MRIVKIAEDAIELAFQKLEIYDWFCGDEIEEAKSYALAEVVEGTTKEQRQLDAFPDLLAACESMLRHIDQVGDDGDLVACRKRLIDAIFKAKGEQS